MSKYNSLFGKTAGAVKGNSFFDSKEFNEFILGRTQKVLIEDEEYQRLQNLCCEIYSANDIASYADIQNDIDTKAQNLCYIQGWKDAIAMLMGQ